MENSRTLDERVYREYAYLRGYRDMAFFAKTFFPHLCERPFSTMHEDFCRAEQQPQPRGQKVVIAAPRGNAKTTLKLHIKIIHAIVYEYEPFILILTHAKSEAREKGLALLEELEQNTAIQQVYGSFSPRTTPGHKVKSPLNFVTTNGIRVTAKSRGQQIRGIIQKGNRPSLIICDDIEAPGEVLSPEQRQKTREWFFKDVMKVGQVDHSTNITVIGTCLHPESLLSELLCNPGFLAAKYHSVICEAENTALWDAWRALYTDLSDPNRIATAQAFYRENEPAMLAGSQVLWPEVESYECLMRMRVDGGEASFNSEKQNDPYDPERQIFDMRKAKRVSVQWSDGQFAVIRENYRRPIPQSELQIVAFHDPALEKKPSQHSEPCYSAIVVVAKDRDGYLYCLDASLAKDAISQQIARTMKLIRKWGVQRLYFEDNGFQSALRPFYQNAMAQPNNKVILLIGVTQTENKFERVATLEADITNGYLQFADTLDRRMIEQLQQFPTGYVDGPDALEGAVRQLRRRVDAVRLRPLV